MLEDLPVTRRAVVAGALAAGGLRATRAAHACDGPACCSGARTWSASGFADGADVVVRTGGLVLDRDARVGRLTVARGAWLAFDPRRSVRLAATGNVVVEGLLRLAPRTAAQQHVLVFPEVDEAAFVGGGMQPVDSDVGLWITGVGRLELQGAARTPWVRLAEPAAAGARRLVLALAPTGWRAGDELTVTPTTSPADTQAHTRYDTVRVVSVSGRVVTVDRPLRHAHPVVRVTPELAMGAEVLNLTRNVRVEGTPAGRAHVWLSSRTRSVLEHTALRHLGPRQATGDGSTTSVLGRYALHLHMNRDASRGTRVTGVVVRDAGAHAFVPHASHGVTFEGCVSHATTDDAFWYDAASASGGESPQDLTYDGCVASLVRTDPPPRGFRLTGFWLGGGRGSTVTRCTAVGVQGTSEAAGFQWPEGDEGLWRFRDNVAHDYAVHGAFVWQNNSQVHVVECLVAYHNGGSGVAHGAYVNRYRYLDNVLHGDARSAVLLHALGRETAGLSFVSCVLDSAGLSAHGVVTTKHQLVGRSPVRFQDCALRGHRVSGFGFPDAGQDGTSQPELLEVLDCSITGNELLFADGAAPGAKVRFQRTGEVSLMVGGPADAGTPFPRWNARFRSVAPLRRGPRRARVSPSIPPAGPVGRRTALPVCPHPAGAPVAHAH